MWSTEPRQHSLLAQAVPRIAISPDRILIDQMISSPTTLFVRFCLTRKYVKFYAFIGHEEK